MSRVVIKAFAKINLSLDIKGIREDGYHEIETVMQQIELHDDVAVCWRETAPSEGAKSSSDLGINGKEIILSTNRPYLPRDSRNLAYKAAQIMIEKFGDTRPDGTIRIDIKKRIPVAAGMAGGSSNGAAVLIAINSLWGLDLSVSELCGIGAKLGSDVPFCVMGQAKGNYELPKSLARDKDAATCVLATGTGTDMQIVTPLRNYIVVAKPPIHVSTAEVYAGIDRELEEKSQKGMPVAHPDSRALAEAILDKDINIMEQNMVNVLELYTAKKHPEILEMQGKLQKESRPIKVMMSGSGPTVFAVYSSKEEARKGYDLLAKTNRETFLTKTIW